MTKIAGKGVLVGVDGSERSMHTVKYVGSVPGFCRMGVTLFSAYSEVPDAYWDLKGLPQFKQRIAEIQAWETQSKSDMEVKLREAKKILVKSGMPEEAVIVQNRKIRQGVARDLIKEGKGHKAIAIGRRSSSKIKDLLLGSVSTKLIESVDFVPLILVGKDSTANRVLVALDGSPNSMRSLAYLVRMMAGAVSEILLFHAIRSKDREFIKLATESIEEVFEQGRGKLAKAGFGDEDVKTKIVTGVHSRAAAIVDEARKGDYRTIVVGRRGLSRLQQFFMGRVSKKIVYLARGLAVWIVN